MARPEDQPGTTHVAPEALLRRRHGSLPREQACQQCTQRERAVCRGSADSGGLAAARVRAEAFNDWQQATTSRNGISG
jgi:hypothetical protein